MFQIYRTKASERITTVIRAAAFTFSFESGAPPRYLLRLAVARRPTL